MIRKHWRHGFRTLVGTVDRPSGERVARRVQQQLKELRKDTPVKGVANVLAVPLLMADAEGCMILAECTDSERPILEDTVKEML